MKILSISTRETTVINLIAWGYSNKAIAERLGLSVKTIETHRYNALRKLRLSDRPAVVRYALEQGWLRVDAAPSPPPAPAP
jgi:DNA-binding NarL/FixJ family response regulator